MSADGAAKPEAFLSTHEGFDGIKALIYIQ